MTCSLWRPASWRPLIGSSTVRAWYAHSCGAVRGTRWLRQAVRGAPAIALGLLLPCAFVTSAEAVTRYVDAAAAGANNGSSWANAFMKLQDALAVAASGDQIWVARGVYYPDEGAGQTNGDRSATFQLLNGVTLYGGFAGTETVLAQRNPSLNVTVLSGDIDQNDTTDANGVVLSDSGISGDNSYQVVTGSGTNGTAVLDGFTVTAGLANGGVGPCVNICGAGLFNNGGSPTLRNLVFSGNLASNAGGGMANINSSQPTLQQVTFRGNRAGQGAGMANLDGSSPTVRDALFTANLTPGNAGGMFNLNSSSPLLERVVFVGNGALVNGGGMLNQNNSSPTISSVAFFGNSAGFGGGMYNIAGSNPTLVNVVFSGNSALGTGGGAGGGMLNNGSSPTLTNVTFSSNVAAGSIQQAGGMLNGAGSNPTLVNVILWGNIATVPGTKEMLNSGSTPTIFFSLIEGSGGSGIGWSPTFGTDGGGNIDADPRFVDPDGADNTAGTVDDNLRLRRGSPAIDAGNNLAAGLVGVTTDLDGKSRFADVPETIDTGQGTRPIVDMGAYEFPSSAASVSALSLWASLCTVLALLAVAWSGLRDMARAT
jgi:hypothetical protein